MGPRTILSVQAQPGEVWTSDGLVVLVLEPMWHRLHHADPTTVWRSWKCLVLDDEPKANEHGYARVEPHSPGHVGTWNLETIPNTWRRIA